MRVSVERIENNVAYLEVEIDRDRIEKALDQAYRDIVKRVSIPGFRKGKAPRPILERHVGKGALYEEALDRLVPEAYVEAVKEAGIEPVDRPDVQILGIEENQPLRFKASVTVKPEVHLGEYKGVRVEKVPVMEVSEAEVDHQLESLRDRHSQLVAVEEGVIQEDSYVILDVEAAVDDFPLPGTPLENFMVKIGAGQFPPGFDVQIMGARIGEEREFTLTLPADFQPGDLAGKEATFRVRVKELKKKQLPELNDDLARLVGQYQSLQELRQELENKLKQMADDRARKLLEDRVIQAVVDQAAVDIPEVMIKDREEALTEDLMARLQSLKLSLAEFLGRLGQEEETFRKDIRERAHREVKTELVLEAVARKEGIKAEEADLDAEAEKLAEIYNQPADTVKRLLFKEDNLRRIERGIIIRKTIQFLANNAVQVSTPEETGEAG